jgi:hypothetical protein
MISPMLHIITQLSDPLCAIIKDDPVRPEIPIEQRVTDRGNIFVLLDDYSKPLAAVCVLLRDTVPKTVTELFFPNVVEPDTAVFYTIWSYQPGAGRELILQARSWISANLTGVDKFVTLSPPTDMARRFHLKNGAGVLSVNGDTVNYIYQ